MFRGTDSDRKLFEFDSTGNYNRRTPSDCADISKLKIKNRPVIKVTLNKMDPQKVAVDNVDFEIKVDGGYTVNGEQRMSNGDTVIIAPDEGQNTVTVTLTEQDPGEEFVKYKDPIVLTFELNESRGEWELKSASTPKDPEKVEIKNSVDGNGVITATIDAVNRRQIIVDFIKKDNGGKQIEMKFTVDVSGGTFDDGTSAGPTSKTFTTGTSGSEELKIIPTGTGNVTLTFTEEDDIYYINPGPITITFSYADGHWQAVNTPEYAEINKTTNENGVIVFELTIENTAKIEDFTFEKINAYFEDESISGVTFNVVLDNAETEDGRRSITVQTEGGEIELGILKVLDPSKDITITLTETGVPTGLDLNYKGLEGATITITLRHKEGIISVTVSNGRDDLVEADYNDNKVSLEIKNEVTLDLSGKVWLDGQTGLKPVVPPDSKYGRSENGIPGIKVSLKGDREDSTVTDSNGNYSFKDLPASTTGRTSYYIEFTYDGINYITVSRGVGSAAENSDVDEVNRAAFNNKFNTIEKDKATVGNVNLSYNHSSSGDTATLITTDASGVKADFAMTATTLNTKYNQNTTDIDMGLVKRGLDLAALTNLEKAVMRINGQETTYPYNALQGLEKDENGNIKINTYRGNKVQYNLYLYASDYNYRIHDYSQVVSRREGSALDPELSRTTAEELNVTLTYRALLNNQSTANARINKVAYYYDSNSLNFIQVINADTGASYTATPSGTAVIDGKTYTKLIVDVGADLDAHNTQEELLFVFTVKLDNPTLAARELLVLKNWIEITSYSSSEGLIDGNSAPDNIDQANYRFEDDSDDASGLNVQVSNEKRKISGFVFEDGRGTVMVGDGNFDAGTDKKVNDVIVQLIEIKELDTDGDGEGDIKLEYIWKETTSGSNRVIELAMDGKSTSTNAMAQSDGGYTFEDFIPGNYIIRFIYGDGTYFDTAITGEGTRSEQQENILKYNGQDYKSTYDRYYMASQFEPYANANASMARDNEARRLRQMAWANGLSKSEIEAGALDINKDNLKNTWMCAETSKVAVPAEAAPGSSSGSTLATAGEITLFENNINFGLVERPKPDLKLEKHLTTVHLTAGGVDKVYAITEQPYEDGTVDDFSNYARDGIVNLKSGIGTGNVKLPQPTVKGEDGTIGSWGVECNLTEYTDVNLELHYTYIISNAGGEEYIGQALDEETRGKTGADVKAVYENLASQIDEWNRKVKSDDEYKIGKYLGKHYYDYYTDSSSGDVAVGIPVKLEDYLVNNRTYKKVELKGDGREKKYDISALSEEQKVYFKGQSIPDKIGAKVITSDEFEVKGGESKKFVLVTEESISTSKECQVMSSTAQLTFADTITSRTGRIIKDLGTLATAADGSKGGVTSGMIGIHTEDVAPQNDEFIAEAFVIQPVTGGNKQTPIILITTIAAGLVIVAVGIVLIKKFIIK